MKILIFDSGLWPCQTQASGELQLGKEHKEKMCWMEVSCHQRGLIMRLIEECMHDQKNVQIVSTIF